MIVVNAVSDTAVASKRERNPVEFTVIASLVVSTINNAVSDVLHFPALIVNEYEAIFDKSTRSAIIVGGTTAGNVDARLGSRAPRLTSRANALKSLAIVVSGSRAISRNVVASVGKRTPSGSSFESQTVSTVIIGSAAGRDNNAQLTSDAPGLSSGTSAFASRAVVVGWVRTVKRESVTLVCN